MTTKQKTELIKTALIDCLGYSESDFESGDDVKTIFDELPEYGQVDCLQYTGVKKF